eukprot:1145584-Prorocentrum_minimum.AAC.4
MPNGFRPDSSRLSTLVRSSARARSCTPGPVEQGTLPGAAGPGKAGNPARSRRARWYVLA